MHSDRPGRFPYRTVQDHQALLPGDDPLHRCQLTSIVGSTGHGRLYERGTCQGLGV